MRARPGRGGPLRKWLAAAASLAVAAAGLGMRPASAAAATAATCGLANAGTGTYASTLCWLDMSGYDAGQATSPGGQQFAVALPGGYMLAFTLSASGGPVAPHAFPTYGGAYLGNTGRYSGVPGKPALYQTTSGTTTTATVSNIAVTDAAGHPVTGYALVGADAESTDSNESLTWTSNVPLKSINPLGNACGGGFTGAGATTVRCVGKSVASKTGTAILAAENPSTITQTMVGAGLQAFAFGVLISRVQLTKTVVNGFSSDAFGIAVHDSSGNLVGSANTGASGASATTGPLTVLTGAGGEAFTLSESATAGTLGNYVQSWACSRNGSRDPSVPGGSGTSATVTLGIGDFEDCTITNTAEAASLSLVKKAGTPVDVNHDGLVDAGDTISYTFDVRNTGELTLDSVAVTDTKVGPVSCPQSALMSGHSMTCTAGPYTIAAADVTAGAVDNTATATGVPVGETARISSPPSSTHTPTMAPNPAITVVKSASPNDAAHFLRGQTITYSFVVTNTGNVPLTDVAVDDGEFSGVAALEPPDCPASTLAPKAQMTCTAEYTIRQGDVDAGHLTNSATATGTPPNGSPVTSPPSHVTIPAPSNPGIALQKTADPATITRAGQQVTYDYVVTNTGNLTLHGIEVVDAPDDFTGHGAPPVPSCPATPSSLAPGQQLTCSGAYTPTQADVDAGTFTNTATASAAAPDGTPVKSEPSAATVTATQAAQLTLVKTPRPATVTKAGDAVTYTFTATNTGNVTLTGVTIAEGAFSGTGTLSALDCADPATVTLVPGAHETCTARYAVTQADMDTGILTNAARATGTAPDGSTVGGSAGATVTATPAPAITVVKSASPNDAAHFARGQTISYSFLVTNTGNVTLTQIAVTDTGFTGSGSLGQITCPDATLAPAEQTTCTANYTLTQADIDAGQVSNAATATGLPPSGAPPVSPPSTVIVPGNPSPALDLAKTASPTRIGKAGVPITYTFVITNTGNVTVHEASIAEGAFSGTGTLSPVKCPAAAATLGPGAQVTCIARYTATQADVDRGSITNTATATGTAPSGQPVTSDPSSATVASTAAGALVAHKSGHAVDTNHDGRTDPGDRIDWTIAVTNVGVATVTHVAVNDPTAGVGTCPVSSLPPGGSMTCTVPAHAVTDADVTAGRVTNTATVGGSNSRGTPISSDPTTASVAVTAAPAIPTGGGTSLANTGRNLESPLILGGVLLAVGSVLFLLALRRRG